MKLHKLAQILAAGCAVFTASSARADQVSTCPNGSALLYYVLDGMLPEGAAPASLTLAEYHRGPKTFTTGGTHERVVQERAAEILYAVCYQDLQSFGTSAGIGGYNHLGGELWSVHAMNGQRIGTVWYDYLAPFAQGGGVAIQKFFLDCPGVAPVLLANAGVWHTGLDRSAMSAPGEDMKQFEYFARVTDLLGRATVEHISLDEGCSMEISKEEFIATLDGAPHHVHYDNFDPAYGVAAQQGQ